MRHHGDSCGSTDAQRLNDLLTFISNGITHSGKETFGIWKPSKLNVSWWNEWTKELNAGYREPVSHWNIAGRPRSGTLAELKCRARAAFRHQMIFFRENGDQIRSQSMLSKLQRGECNDFWKEIKVLNPKKEFLVIAMLQTYGKFISVQ